MKKLLIILCILIAGCGPAIKVTKVTSKEKPEGVFYSLPKTILIINIPVQKTIKTPGKYEKFKGLLGIQEAIIERSTTYSLGETSVSSASVPDSSAIFKVSISKNFFKKSSFAFDFKDNSLLQGFQSSQEDKTYDMVVSIVNSAASVVGSVFGFKAEAPKDSENVKKLQHKIDSIALASGKKISPEDKTILIKLISDIAEIRQNRLHFLTSTNVSDPNSLKKILDELKAMEESYFAYFVGTIESSVKNYKYSIDLKKSDENLPLAYFSKNRGMDNDSMKIKGANVFFITTSVPKQICTELEPYSPENKRNRGFYYRIGRDVRCNLFIDKQNAFSNILLIPQLGEIVSLPAGLQDFQVKLYQDMGTLKSLSGKFEAMQTSSIENTGKTIVSAIDQFKQKSELELLEDQRKLLEEKVKIQELLDKLNAK